MHWKISRHTKNMTRCGVSTRMMLFGAVALVLALTTQQTAAFATPPAAVSSCARLTTTTTSTAKSARILNVQHSSSLLLVRGDNGEKDTKEEDDDDDDSASLQSSNAATKDDPAKMKSSDDNRIRIRIPIGFKYALDAIYTVWSYGIIVMGTALSLGLALNIFGYAFVIQDGDVRIDTIEQLRTENQFRIEIRNSMKQSLLEERDTTIP